MVLGSQFALPPSFTPILDTVLDAVVVMAKDGSVLAWNRVSEEVFGWTPVQCASCLELASRSTNSRATSC